MSNPTTPFSWQMPTNTDLVTDLPADFEVFGQAVATSMADLLGGTTGQILSKTSNTDMDFTWIANDQGDITNITAGTGILVTSPTGPVPTIAIDTAVTVDKTTAQTLTNKTLTSPALTTPTISTATTNGDLLYGTGSGALTRLGIGSTAQVLTVTAGVPSWAAPASGGGMTLLSTTTLSGSSTTISSISQGYKTLYAVITGVTHTGSSDAFTVRPNGVTTGIAESVYYSIGTTTYNTAYTNTAFFVNFVGTTVSDTENSYVLQIDNYTSTNSNKPMFAYGQCLSSSGSQATSMTFGGDRQNSAITSLEFLINAGGTSLTGGTVLLYGVK